MYTILSAIIGYILGSIPNALIIGKIIYNKDVRLYGSGNLGGSNTGRVLGKKAGVTVMVLDVAKAILSIIITYYLFYDLNYLLICGLFSNIGHCYPIFANFKGGKAVSTFIGYLMGISFYYYHDPLFYLLPIIVFIIILYITKIVSISSILCSLSISLYLYIKTGLSPTFIMTLFLSSVLILRHKSNILRIIYNKENKITWM